MLCRSFDLSGCAFLYSGHLLTPGRRCLCHLVRVYVLQAEPDATHGDDKTSNFPFDVKLMIIQCLLRGARTWRWFTLVRFSWTIYFIVEINAMNILLVYNKDYYS